MGRFIGAGLLLAILAVAAQADSRFPATVGITFRQGAPAHAIAGLTFGFAITHDDGATWHWICPQAIGYAGTYDPDVAYASNGTVIATTFNGLTADRDGCTFTSTTDLGQTFVSQAELGADGALYAAAVDPADAKIYRSADVAVTFPTSAAPGQANDWWQSLVAAPNDAQRIYLSGYRIVATTRTYLLFASSNGGTSFAALPTTDFTVSANSTISIVAVSPTSADVVYAKVSFETGTTGDAIYKSTTGGASWTRILGKPDSLSFVVRGNGDLVAGARTGAWVSHDGGTTWLDLTAPPHIACLVEKPNGEVWACTQWPADGYAIMKTTDLAAWNGVFRLQDLADPVDCPAGTVQHDTCASGAVWCGVRAELGITTPSSLCGPDVDAAPDAAPPVDGPPIDGASADAGIAAPPTGGCCDGSGGSGALPLVVLLGITARRRGTARRSAPTRARPRAHPRWS